MTSKREQLIEFFRDKGFQGYGCTPSLAQLLVLAKLGKVDKIIEVKGRSFQLVQVEQRSDYESGLTATFLDVKSGAYFQITGDSDSWGQAYCEYTSPSDIKMVKPTKKVVRVFEEVIN